MRRRKQRGKGPMVAAGLAAAALTGCGGHDAGSTSGTSEERPRHDPNPDVVLHRGMTLARTLAALGSNDVEPKGALCDVVTRTVDKVTVCFTHGSRVAHWSVVPR